MAFTIKNLSKRLGISVRTLHYYDTIGLVVPYRNKRNGYRMYTEYDVKRLEHILLLRDLGLSLVQIKYMLNDVDCKEDKILEHQRHRLSLKRSDINKHIKTIDKKLKYIKNKVTPSNLYNILQDAETKKYQKEVLQKWGNTPAYKESEKRMSQMTKDSMNNIKNEWDQRMKDIVHNIDLGYDNDTIQLIIHEHYNSLRAFYTPTPGIYKSLADLYIHDKRFRKFFDKYDKRLAQFMHDAIIHYTKNTAL